MTSFSISNFDIGRSGRCFIIGEVAQAHDGSLGMAHAYIDAIADCGGDAVKFQTHIADAESTPEEPWRVKFSKQDATRFDYWKRMEFTPEQWLGLKQHCDERNIIFLSSPFSMQAVDLLLNIGIDAWKIASGEVNNIPLVNRLLKTNRPILISSGMSYLHELKKVTGLCKKECVPFGIFQCTTAYPCPPEKIGLNLIDSFRQEFACPVGLSDHSGEIYSSLAAVTLGCELLEVHITFNKKMFGPDTPSSLDLDQFKMLVNGVRYTEQILAHPVNKTEMVDEISQMRELFTKSLVASENVFAGSLLIPENVTLKKPGTGISVEKYDQYIGKRLRRNVSKGSFYVAEDFE
ncbi:N-acetylneuraminate synthase family protein [Verrucomicrobia bacterium]|nr:N-acetylneuraminate synthase family protein [Verrucomicrobiota bacterium]